ncbi:MAG TPA: hypothetical protein PK857_00435 [Hyphomicrobium sp.]|nr:hypothetical protein [Hyphomicrobium sp.]HRO48793.1 hypothetical protein [Hyphomicrobium sp.]
MKLRTITADQYRLGSDEEGYDEAFLIEPATGTQWELWDVRSNLDEDGNVVLYTAHQAPMHVRPDHQIYVR